jgi:hypothetical protein
MFDKICHIQVFFCDLQTNRVILRFLKRKNINQNGRYLRKVQS